MLPTTDSPSSFRPTLQRVGQLLCFTCLIASCFFLSRHSLALTSSPGWNASNINAAFDPVNRRGRNPLERPPAPGVHIPTLRKSSNALQDAAGAGSSNFQITVPVVNVPGRGIDLALALTYNSRVWTIAGSLGRFTLFDIDADWPAPGWSLGFGKLVVVDDGTHMFIDADGTRHPYVETYDSGTQISTAHTTCGTLIDYWINGPVGQGPSGGVKYPNGTIVTFTEAAGITSLSRMSIIQDHKSTK